MRLLPTAAVLALSLVATPAAAQLSNRSIALESGLSRALGAGGRTGGAVALAATLWLDGDVEGVARASLGSADGTAGRGATSAISGTVGLRFSVGRAPVRPQLTVDLGWARTSESGSTSDRLAFGLGAALETFLARDLSVAFRASLRGAGGDLALEAMIAAAAYF